MTKGTKRKRRALICDDNPTMYEVLKVALAKHDIEVAERKDDAAEVLAALNIAAKEREFYELVLIDLNLGIDGVSGMDVYNLANERHPNETYIVYTTQDSEAVRRQIQQLAYRNVWFLLFTDPANERHVESALAFYVLATDPEYVFLVCGRNEPKNVALRRVLEEDFGLRVVNMEDAGAATTNRHVFDIVLQGIEMSHATIVLFTDDETVSLREGYVLSGDRASHERRQPRGNVLIEAGYALGKRPRRTIFVEWADDPGKLEWSSDFGGVHYLKFGDSIEHKRALYDRLVAARCQLSTRP